jgi:hypothetical protein
VGRLDNIIARNRAAQRRGLRKLLVTGGVVAMLIAIAAMLLFTDLGQPATQPRAAPTHVDGIYLGAPRQSGHP